MVPKESGFNLRKETCITVILMTVGFITFVNSLKKLLWTCLFGYTPMVK